MTKYLILIFADQDIKVRGTFDDKEEAVKELTKKVSAMYGYESWEEFGEGNPEVYEYVRNNIMHNSGIMIDLGEDDDFGWMCYKLLTVEF